MLHHITVNCIAIHLCASRRLLTRLIPQQIHFLLLKTFVLDLLVLG